MVCASYAVEPADWLAGRLGFSIAGRMGLVYIFGRIFGIYPSFPNTQITMSAPTTAKGYGISGKWATENAGAVRS